MVAARRRSRPALFRDAPEWPAIQDDAVGTHRPVTQKVTVRMETPVLYFYSARKTTVSVAVDFPKGLITEWYPHASKSVPVPH